MESRTIGADEVAEALGMSRAYAYKLIRRLNKEMEERGASPCPGGSAARTSRSACSRARGIPMSVTRDKRNGTWYVQAWYKTYDGKRAHKVKRGFKTKPEALAWERDFYAVQAGDMDMKLVDFLELYKKDMGPRLRLNTWKTKESIITKRILPYLGEKRMNQIAPVDIVRWQNELMALEKPSGGGFSATYLKTVNNQLCALFNHAVRFYGLSSNPCRRAESMGSKSAGEMRFWTKDQYLRFSDEIMDKPLSFHAFETLYWCGVREGELLALKPHRFDFERGTLTIAESYQRIDGQDVLTDPKTPKSKRVIAMPGFYAEEMEAFLSLLDLDPDERIFPVTKYFLSHEMARGSKAAGLEPIRVHDLRHSHVSLLIDMGFTAIAVADRMGHEAADITYRHAHLFPSVQDDMARALDGARREN